MASVKKINSEPAASVACMQIAQQPKLVMHAVCGNNTMSWHDMQRKGSGLVINLTPAKRAASNCNACWLQRDQ